MPRVRGSSAFARRLSETQQGRPASAPRRVVNETRPRVDSGRLGAGRAVGLDLPFKSIPHQVSEGTTVAAFNSRVNGVE